MPPSPDRAGGIAQRASRGLLFLDFSARMQSGNLPGRQWRSISFFAHQPLEVGKLKAGRAHHRRSKNLRSLWRVQTGIHGKFISGRELTVALQ